MRTRALVPLLVLTVASACSASPGNGASQPAAHPITVLAASSLRTAFTAAGDAYENVHPGSVVSFGFDASSAIRTKIEQGAPADLFASADATNAQKLVDDGYAIGPPQLFAGNRLAIVVPLDNPAHIQTPADLASPGVRLVAASEGVPISAYASQLIARLAGQAGYPAAYATKVADNVASREDNVAAVVAKVAIGEGDAGIVYGTDALASSSLKEVPIPKGAGVLVTYAAVVVKASRQTDAALAFLSWLRGPAGQAALARFGFVAP